MKYFYLGIDVSKFYLDVAFSNQFFRVKNDTEGYKELLKKINDCQENTRLFPIAVMEASGGYERPCIEMFHQNQVATHLAHANKVKFFARSKGYVAKTDKIDAKIILEYAHLNQIVPDNQLLSKEALAMQALLKRRDQLMKQKMQEKNRLEKYTTNKEAKRSLNNHINWLDREIKKLDLTTDKLIKRTESLQIQVNLLKSIPGIGPQTAHYFLAFLPELGRYNEKQLAALVGVAPFNNDSGRLKGKRRIFGGRKNLRDKLYMAALVSSQHHPDLAQTYKKLKAKGKPAKVVLIAVARKLLIQMNCVLCRQSPWQKERLRHEGHLKQGGHLTVSESG